ncbi:MAG: hypothetical protein LBI03_07455 [Clostridiales bacterium]|nr:hypothetical protein [Clostridiales bacterium]
MPIATGKLISQMTIGEIEQSVKSIGAVNLLIFHAFRRVGCSLSGCCYGVDITIFGHTFGSLRVK